MKEVIKEIDKKIKDHQLLLKEAMYIDDLLYSKFDEDQWYKLFNIYTMDVFEVQIANIQSAVGDQIDSITLTYRMDYPKKPYSVLFNRKEWRLQPFELEKEGECNQN